MNNKNIEHDGCIGCKYEHFTSTSSYCQGCKRNAVDKYTRITNADRVRAMTNEELAEFLVKIAFNENLPCMMIDEDCKKFPDVPEDDKGCKDCFKEWLESEVDDL